MPDQDFKQAQAFKQEIDKVVDRFSKEFDLSVAEALGVLILVIFDLCRYTETNIDQK
jgi:hypothetical protein